MQVDLNLLVALDALLDEGSVQGAADRLHLTPPAMSHTLGRIRRATGDQILVRDGRRMIPTPHALELREETRDLVARGAVVLSPARTLDLSRLDRVFTIRAHDALVGTIASALAAAISAEAPLATMRILAESTRDDSDVLRGHIDIELGSGSAASAALVAKKISTNALALVHRIGHPVEEKDLTLEVFAGLKHVVVSRRGRLHGVIDEILAGHHLKRSVVGSLPTSWEALDLVAATNLVTVVAGSIGEGRHLHTAVRSRSLPFELPGSPIVMTWHQRFTTDPAHVWLRSVIEKAVNNAPLNRDFL